VPTASDNWKRIEELFFAAADLSEAERRRFLDEHCGDDALLRSEVEALIEADEGPRQKLKNVVSSAAGALQDEQAPQEGRRIGPYVLVRKIGQGGMGTVYQAIRADGEFHQSVAIKLIKRGMDSEFIIRRFRQERHILARLNHPNIARLLDGGTTDDGQPYLVMDFVDGVPITKYCEEHKLTVRERLQLFLTACDAVQHAHENLVVHRDLKPANVLVTRDRQTKLLDFGIAKWLDPDASPETVIDTFPGLRMLTPEYASPEQVRGEAVTEAADVYVLGAILCELLTGERAHKIQEFTPASVAYAVCEKPVQRPSLVTANAELRGNLDNIVMKAMEKEIGLRYASVAEFAADLRNHLEGRRVQARGEGVPHRARRAISKHRVGLSAVAAVLIVSLLAASISWKRRAAERVESIAVLPFVNLGMQATEDRLADGLTEDLITEFANTQGLKTTSRTTVWQYKGKAFDVREAGRAMGVQTVLEGSVRRADGEVRVVAQLINVGDGFHLWAQSYDRKADSSLALQRELSQLIAAELKQRMAGSGKWNIAGRTASDSEASREYLEGYRLFQMNEINAAWKSGIPAQLQAAMDAFDRAVQKDPNFAAGWASVAEISEWAIGFDESKRQELRAKSEAAAHKALQLEPTNSLASATLGLIYRDHDWDLRKADPFLRRAVEINPRSTGLQAEYADLLMKRGRVQEAQEILLRAQVLEPSVGRLPARLAGYLAWMERCSEARRYANHALSLTPQNRHALWALALCADLEGKNAEAETRYRELMRLSGAEQRSEASLGHVLARTGRREEARKIAANLASIIERGRRREVFAALVHAALGENEKALTLLEQAWKMHDSNLLNLHLEPRFRVLNREPRFQQLLARVKALQ